MFAAQRDETVDVSDAADLTRLRLALTTDTVLAELAADGAVVAMDVPHPGLSQTFVSVSDIAPGGGGWGMVRLCPGGRTRPRGRRLLPASQPAQAGPCVAKR